MIGGLSGLTFTFMRLVDGLYLKLRTERRLTFKLQHNLPLLRVLLARKKLAGGNSEEVQ